MQSRLFVRLVVPGALLFFGSTNWPSLRDAVQLCVRIIWPYVVTGARG